MKGRIKIIWFFYAKLSQTHLCCSGFSSSWWSIQNKVFRLFKIIWTPIDIKIPVEDVEPTAVLDFPPSSSEGTADIAALKNAISSLQQDVSKLKSGETSVSSDGGEAYDFAIFGLSIAAAAIILAIIALVKRK